MTAPPKRPDFIRLYKEIERPFSEPWRRGDLRVIAASFGSALGLQRLGIHHETVEPGCRTSLPHAESHEEEFVFVIEGQPDVWIDGYLHPLVPGDGVAFPAGTGITHTFIDNTDAPVRLLVVGERNPANKHVYPLNPERKASESYWHAAPQRPLGPHDGKPTRPRSES